jgi:hypothetical protein
MRRVFCTHRESLELLAKSSNIQRAYISFDEMSDNNFQNRSKAGDVADLVARDMMYSNTTPPPDKK